MLLMKMKNVVLSLVFTLLLYFSYANRYSFEPIAFQILFFGLLIAGGFYAYREWISRDDVKSDERTQLIAGKAARFTLVASVVVVILILAFLAYSGRPTSPNGILAVLLGIMSLAYSIAYAYLERKM